MKAIATPITLCVLIVLLVNGTAPSAQALEPIRLTPPDLSHSKPLMQTLKQRQSTKGFVSKPIPGEMLSNLLWAAIGINRPDSGKRTIATASNCQDMDVYVVFAEGAYVYEAQDHRLNPVLAKDVRALAATQGYAQKAAIQLVYVSD
ncbi:MAG: SagB/ThcOx family dehydrogenase, partial [Planctomycetes bacterium]|nr:SagB/ThcOx family dehydrogenase [Planctomycetota bacterium]